MRMGHSCLLQIIYHHVTALLRTRQISLVEINSQLVGLKSYRYRIKRRNGAMPVASSAVCTYYGFPYGEIIITRRVLLLLAPAIVRDIVTKMRCSARILHTGRNSQSPAKTASRGKVYLCGVDSALFEEKELTTRIKHMYKPSAPQKNLIYLCPLPPSFIPSWGGPSVAAKMVAKFEPRFRQV